MTDTSIYFGRPGTLVTLIAPRGGIQATRIRPVSVFNLGSGGVRTGKLPGGKRRYTLSWQSLAYSDFATLEAYEQGHNGPGPFALLDPGRRNLLTANQSAATSETNSTANFTVAGSGGTLTSESTVYHRGPRSLKWSFTVTTPASATVSLDAPSTDWSGIPVVSRSLTFSCYVKGGGTDPVVTLTPKLTWLDTAGATLSTSSGNNTISSSASWQQASVTASAPASAAYVNASIAASGATITNGSIVYLDEFMLNEGAAADSAWSPGTGVVPVEIVSLTESQQWAETGYRLSPVLTLQEVGA